MPSVSALDVYEIAYLCGGPPRVALTAVVAMQQDGRIKISPRRHWIQVVHRSAHRPLENAVLDAVPASGQMLGAALHEVAKSAAVDQLIEGLRGRGLVAQHALLGRSHLSAAGRQARQELEEAGANVRRERRVAVLGTAGLASARLRDIFETPDPPPGAQLTPRTPKSRDPDPAEGYSDSSLPEYPGVSNRW